MSFIATNRTHVLVKRIVVDLPKEFMAQSVCTLSSIFLLVTGSFSMAQVSQFILFVAILSAASCMYVYVGYVS